MNGGPGSNRTEGPDGVPLPEKRPLRRGKMKRRSSGRSDCSDCRRDGGGALGSARC